MAAVLLRLAGFDALDCDNPIEQIFTNSPPAFPTSCACWNLKPASLKHLLRKASERTIYATWTRIGHLLNVFTKEECGRYLVKAGYPST